MHLIKPLTVELTPRILPQWTGHELTATTIIGFDLTTTQFLPYDRTLPEISYIFEQEPGSYLDLGNPKAFGEILVLGLCTRDENDTEPWLIDIEVGSIHRQAIVPGARFWKKDQLGHIVMTEAEPLYNILLSPAAAFGGQGYEPNPNGQGFNAIQRLEERENEAVLLPLIEDPFYRIKAPEDTPPPVWCSITPLNFPERQKMAGTFDDTWLQEVHPALPKDSDAAYYNDAQSAQWLPTNPPFFQGGEHLRLTGVVPEGPIEGYLPRYRVRQFCLLDTPEASINEVEARCDTVVLIPAHNLGFCCYRGQFPILADDPLGLHVKSLATAFEYLDAEPRPFRYYASLIRRRVGGVGTLVDLEDSALSPPMSAEEITAKRVETETAQQKAVDAITQRRQAIEEYAKEKIDFDQIPENPYAKEPPDPRVEKLQKKATAMTHPASTPNDIELIEFDSQLTEFTNENLAKRLNEVPEEYKSYLKPPTTLPRHPDLLQEEITKRLSGPHTSPTEQNLISAQTLALEHNAPVDKEQLTKLTKARLISPNAVTFWEKMVEKDGWTLGAAMIEASATQKEFKNLDLADSRMKDHTFSDVSFTGCFFERSVFERCRFERCDLTDTTFVESQFTNCTFVNCTFIRTNFSNNKAHSCQFEEFVWKEIRGAEWELTDPVLLGGKISDCTLTKIKCTNLQAERTEWFKCQLIDFVCPSSVWRDTKMTDMTFLNIDWTKVHLDTFWSKKLFLIGLHGQEAVLDQCTMDNTFLVGNSDFTGARFTGVSCQTCGWRESVMSDVTMIDCRFIENDFSQADMSRLQASEVVFSLSRFTSTSLRQADLTQAHLFQCNLEQTDFTEANLTQACLFKASLAKTKFDDARVEFADFRHTELDHKGKVPSTAISS